MRVLKVVLIFLSSLANYLLQLCMYVIEYRRGVFHWLFAMPLLHFLSDTSKPFSFEELTLEPGLKEDNRWGGEHKAWISKLFGDRLPSPGKSVSI